MVQYETETDKGAIETEGVIEVGAAEGHLDPSAAAPKGMSFGRH